MSDYKVGDVLKNGKQTLIIGDEALKAHGWVAESVKVNMNSSGLIAVKDNISITEKIHEPIPIDEIEKAWESISDVAENGYVDMEEIKLWFAKWLNKDEEEL